MNITKESDDYYRGIQNIYIQELKDLNYPISYGALYSEPKDNVEYLKTALKRHKKHLKDMKNDEEVWNKLQVPFNNDIENLLDDKLKTTPDPGFTKINKTFRVNWGNVFKRGWLFWE